MRLLTKACIKVRTLSEEFFRTMEYYQIKITTKSLRRMLINTFKVSIRNCAFTIKLWTKKYSDLVRQCFSPFYSMYNTILGQLLYILYRQTIVPSALVSLVASSITWDVLLNVTSIRRQGSQLLWTFCRLHHSLYKSTTGHRPLHWLPQQTVLNCHTLIYNDHSNAVGLLREKPS